MKDTINPAGYLHERLMAVCPVESVTVGKREDPSTWIYTPFAHATPEQAKNVEKLMAQLQTTLTFAKHTGEVTEKK